MSELKPKGWLMWDKSLSNGFDECMFIHGFEKPTLTDEEQIKHGGDYRGHLWDSIPLYDNPDANLIAAAPEMYKMLDTIETVLSGNSEYNAAEINTDYLKNLLAKARGEK